MFDYISPIYLIVEIFALLRCYAAQIGNYLRPFRGNLSVPSSKGQSSSPLRMESPLWRFRTVLSHSGVAEDSSLQRCDGVLWWVLSNVSKYRMLPVCGQGEDKSAKSRSKVGSQSPQKKTRHIPQDPNPCSSLSSQNPNSKMYLNTDKLCAKVRSLFIYSIFQRTQNIILPIINTDGRIGKYA